MGKEEIENFSLRVFIFSLREICISTNNIVSFLYKTKMISLAQGN